MTAPANLQSSIFTQQLFQEHHGIGVDARNGETLEHIGEVGIEMIESAVMYVIRGGNVETAIVGITCHHIDDG